MLAAHMPPAQLVADDPRGALSRDSGLALGVTGLVPRNRSHGAQR